MGVREPLIKSLTSRGSTIAFLGDSITAGGMVSYNYGDAFPLYALLASGGALVGTGFFGQPGETSTGALGRVGSALAKSPTYLHILYGTNDTGQSTVAGRPDEPCLATLAANITTMCARARAVGTEPIVGTIPPNNSGANSARSVLILKANIWIRRFCIRNSIMLVDYYTLLAKDGIAESPGGNYKTIYAQDGTHPNGAGHGAMGLLLWNTIKNLNYASQVPLLTTLADSLQAVYLARNTLWQGQSGAPGLRPDTWSALGTADAHSVYSLVTNSLIPGNLQRISFDASATTLSLGINMVTTLAVQLGDVISIGGQFISDGGCGVQANIAVPGFTYKPMNITRSTTFALGLYQMEFAAPATGQLTVSLLASGSSGVAGQVDFGYPSVINLTRTIAETTPINAN